MSNPLAIIIEDDPDLSTIFSLALRGGGFDTEVIQDGQLALDRLNGPAPALITLDIHLPNVDGPTILKQIKATPSFAKTIVIVTSADAHQANDLQSKADLVLLKPVSVDQLRDLAKRMLQRWHNQAQQA